LQNLILPENSDKVVYTTDKVDKLSSTKMAVHKKAAFSESGSL
jgi:hypothetical protein